MTAAVWLAAATAAGQTVGDTVARFFPQSLIDLNAALDEPLHRHQCFHVIAADRSGSPLTIVAAYTDGYRAVVRVLQRSGDEFQVAAEPSGLDLWGLTCSIRLVNVSPGRQRVIHLSFEGERNTVDWLFSWNGQELSNLTPLVDTDLGVRDSQLRNADLVDLDGDGALDIASGVNGSGDAPPSPTDVFRWSSGGYEPDRPVVGPWTFERGNGAPTTDRIPFELPAGALGPFSVFVVNGTGPSASRVENARVWLNGREILGASDFGARDATIERPVILRRTNQLDVRLAGPPGRTITVKITVGSWSSP